MVYLWYTKLVRKIHALCNKNEISKVVLGSKKCNVTNHGFAPIHYDTGKVPWGTQLFSCRGVRPGFLECGACKLIFASERGGL